MTLDERADLERIVTKAGAMQALQIRKSETAQVLLEWEGDLSSGAEHGIPRSECPVPAPQDLAGDYFPLSGSGSFAASLEFFLEVSFTRRVSSLKLPGGL